MNKCETFFSFLTSVFPHRSTTLKLFLRSDGPVRVMERGGEKRREEEGEKRRGEERKGEKGKEEERKRKEKKREKKQKKKREEEGKRERRKGKERRRRRRGEEGRRGKERKNKVLSQARSVRYRRRDESFMKSLLAKSLFREMLCLISTLLLFSNPLLSKHPFYFS